MSILDIDLPDLSGHPAAPRVSFERYERWICEEIGPMLAEKGEMAPERLRAEFMMNEGSMPEFRFHG